MKDSLNLKSVRRYILTPRSRYEELEKKEYLLNLLGHNYDDNDDNYNLLKKIFRERSRIEKIHLKSIRHFRISCVNIHYYKPLFGDDYNVIILVEGLADILRLISLGLNQYSILSVGGTSILNYEQIQQFIKKITKEYKQIFFVSDNDKNGQIISNFIRNLIKNVKVIRSNTREVELATSLKFIYRHIKIHKEFEDEDEDEDKKKRRRKRKKDREFVFLNTVVTNKKTYTHLNRIYKRNKKEVNKRNKNKNVDKIVKTVKKMSEDKEKKKNKKNKKNKKEKRRGIGMKRINIKSSPNFSLTPNSPNSLPRRREFWSRFPIYGKDYTQHHGVVYKIIGYEYDKRNDRVIKITKYDEEFEKYVKFVINNYNNNFGRKP